MGVLADTLGGKIPGELIRASDWNDLIDAIEGIEASLDERITSLSDSVDERFANVDAAVSALQETTQGLGERVDEMEATVEALRTRFRRVTMATTRTDYVMGDMAEITATVTALDGSPLPLGDAAARPWVDFVAAWGQLKPAPGFESRGGAGDRSISVRVNTDGIARARLGAEHTEGFTDEAEAEVAAALETVPAGSQLSVKDAILGSSTPMEAMEHGTFRVLTAEYARDDATSVRNYADAYYIKSPALATGKFVSNFFHRWRDYRSTVIAIAKSDADPRTPDLSLGSCSIQVTFRDWIGPWLNLDFFQNLTPLIIDYRDRFGGLVMGDFTDTLTRFQDRIELDLSGKGILGKQRHTQAILDAIGRIEVTDPPPFMEDLSAVVRDGLNVQRALEYGQAAAIGVGDRPLAFQALTQGAFRSDTRAAEVQEQVTGFVEGELGRAQDEIEFRVEQRQADFRNELFAESGMLQNVQRDIRVVTGQMQGFQEALNSKADVQTLARFLPG